MRSLFKSILGIVIAVNTILFVVFGIFNVFTDFQPATLLALEAPLKEFVVRPWGLLTYMFVQLDFFNLLFNMLWLWCFGSIMLRFDTGKLFFTTYIISGVAGGLCFVATAGQTSYLIGASASVLGVIAGCAASHPRMNLNMVILGNVQLRWVALGAILICGIAPGVGNLPTLYAHCGGVVAGWLYVFLFKHKSMMPHSSVISKKQKPKMHPLNVRQHERRGLSAGEQTELDSLLAHVKRSGFKSLSMSDRARLFELSGKINSN